VIYFSKPGSGILLHGDCLEEMKRLPAQSVDMILCDLPYGTTACKWDTVIPFESLWAEYERLCKGAIVLTASQPFTSALVASNIKKFKHEWIWKKSRYTGFLQSKFMPMKAHESVLVFSFSGKTAVYNPQKTVGHIPTNSATGYGHSPTFGASKERNYRGGDTTRFPLSVQHFKNERGLHPTQKPVALFEYMIKTYTNEGALVLDNCAGSGTTAVACENLNRRWCLIEKEQKYCDVTVARLRDNA